MFSFQDSTARAAWAAATTQTAQLEGLRDEWAGQMSVRYYSAADAHLATVTHETPIVDTSTTPYSLRLGAWVAESHVQDGTAAYAILAVPAGADILRCDVTLAGPISDPGGRIRLDIGTTLRAYATASLPDIDLSWLPSVGARADINLNDASAVDLATPFGTAIADEWWMGYGVGSTSTVLGSLTTSYSGAVLALEYGAAGALVSEGGGHGGLIGKIVMGFDFATRSWFTVGEANLPATFGWLGLSGSIATPTYTGANDLRDNAEGWMDYDFNGSYIKLGTHSYRSRVYVPESMGGGAGGSLLLPDSHFQQNPSVPNPANGLPRMWAPHLMNLTTGVLTRAAAAPYGAMFAVGAADAVGCVRRGNRVWYPVEGGTYMYYVDLVDGVLHTRTQHTVKLLSNGATTGYVPAQNTSWLYHEPSDHLVAFVPAGGASGTMAANGVMTVYFYDMATGVPVEVDTITKPTRAMPYGGCMVGVAWHETLEKFYVYEGYGDTPVVTLTPSNPLDLTASTWVWGVETFTGPTPPSKAAFNNSDGLIQAGAVQGRFAYVPAWGALVFHDGAVDNGRVQCWRAPGTPA